jgi:hypothetical protein
MISYDIRLVLRQFKVYCITWYRNSNKGRRKYSFLIYLINIKKKKKKNIYFGKVNSNIFMSLTPSKVILTVEVSILISSALLYIYIYIYVCLFV